MGITKGGMSTPYNRKKQPEVVRRQLLDVAGQLLMDEGVKGLTLDAVAKRSGVSKGGLLHHFPNRQALLVGLFDDQTDQFFKEIEINIAEDPEPHGRVCRAFLKTISKNKPEDNGYLGLLLLRDPAVNARWEEADAKLTSMMSQPPETFPEINVVLFAASGMWLSGFLDDPVKSAPLRKDALEKLQAMTYPKE